MDTFHFSPRPNRAHEIRWRSFSDEAFEQAKTEDKPVLLGISGVWCHWCHVMDETTYSDQTVIEQINQRFIPVRVDTDQRPDVNARYNMGGWPTTALLTPDGEVLYGGTYIPPEAMRQVLRQVDDFYARADTRLDLARRVAEMKTARAGRARTPRGGDLDQNTASTIMSMISSAFDEEYGGFGTDQKFPHVSTLQFLLDDYVRHRDERARAIVQKTLHAMAQGGMYDHVAGGFFRYSTTRDFTVPHFEKMLEDLGGLLMVCAKAGAPFGDRELQRVAIDVKRYMDDHLWVAERQAYGGSQDADEQYYELDAAGRSTRDEPYVDKNIYTSWNAQAAHAMLSAAHWLTTGIDPSTWVERGQALLQTLWQHVLVDGLMCRHFDGAPHVRGLLTDQVWSAWAALAAFSAAADEQWLQRCGALIDAVDVLYDEEAHGYRDRLIRDDDAGRVSESIVPPEDNALMARVLLAYGAMSAQERFAERAEQMLRRYARDYRSLGLFAATYGSAVLDLLEPPVDIHVSGPRNDPRVFALRNAALAVVMQPVRIDSVDPQQTASRAASFGLTAEPAAALCRGSVCFARITEPSQLSTALATAQVR